jgi:ABC-2 type transport system ATP-binding protein
MHLGRIVALGTPAALRSELGSDIVEVRVAGDAGSALAQLREHGVAGVSSFAVGSTLTMPLPEGGATTAIAAVEALELGAVSIGARKPTLDDVYLRLTGDRLAAAA